VDKPKLHTDFGSHLFPGVVFFDCEATGLNPQVEYIIEIGIVGASGEPVLSQLARPPKPIPQRVVEITGISDRDLAGASSEAALIEKVHPILASSSALGGYFIHLDYEYLRCAYARAGRETDFAAVAEKPLICTKTLARRVVPEIGLDFSLADLCRHLDIAQRSHHRAIEDAIMSWQVALALASKAGVQTLKDIIEFQGMAVQAPWELPGSTDDEKAEARKRWKMFVAQSVA
jgi:DNA polymerase III alpha subunit (gram-positive type)